MQKEGSQESVCIDGDINDVRQDDGSLLANPQSMHCYCSENKMSRIVARICEEYVVKTWWKRRSAEGMLREC